jgi:mannose-6-phosphate isomerase-like protein (cupin superfamily)
MSDYSKVNILEDVENSSQTDGLEAFFARKYLDSRDLGVSMFRYAPNFQAAMAHSHKVQEEAYIVIKGSGRILLDENIVDLKLWDVIRVAPEVVRAFAAGPQGLDIIAVGGPKPEGGDGERHKAAWPDKK